MNLNIYWLLFPAYLYIIGHDVRSVAIFCLSSLLLIFANEKNGIILRNLLLWIPVIFITVFLPDEWSIWAGYAVLGGIVLLSLDYLSGETIYLGSFEYKLENLELPQSLKILSVFIILAVWMIVKLIFLEPIIILWHGRTYDLERIVLSVVCFAVGIGVHSFIYLIFKTGQEHGDEKSHVVTNGNIAFNDLQPYWKTQYPSSQEVKVKKEEKKLPEKSQEKPEITDSKTTLTDKASELKSKPEPQPESKPEPEKELADNQESCKEHEENSQKQTTFKGGFRAKGEYAEVLNSAWNDFVEANRNIIVQAGLYEAFGNLFKLLDEEGHYSSVRQKDTKDSARDKSQYDLLAQTSLAEHSVHVAENAFRLINENYTVGKGTVVPKILFAAFAHDIGKILSVSGQEYFTGQHPVDGASYVRDVLLRDKGKLAESVSHLIAHHHDGLWEQTPKDLTILIKADQAARKQELAENTQKYKEEKEKNTSAPPQADGNATDISGVMVSDEPVKKRHLASPLDIREIPVHFPTVEIFRRLLPSINYVKKGGYFYVFSQPDGNIYLQAETVHAVIGLVAQEHGFTEPFYTSTDPHIKKSCLQSFCNLWRKQGYVPEKLVGPKFYGNFFLVFNPRTNKPIRTFYMVLKASAFGYEPKHFEKQRLGNNLTARIKIYGVAATKEQQEQLMEKFNATKGEIL